MILIKEMEDKVGAKTWEIIVYVSLSNSPVVVLFGEKSRCPEPFGAEI